MGTGAVAMAYTRAAMERAMKVADVLLHALKERQPWIHVAEVLGVSPRTVRRPGRRRRAQAGDGDVGPSPSTPGTSTPGRRGERRRRPIASTWRAEGAGRPEPSSRPTRRRRSRPVGPSHRAIASSAGAEGAGADPRRNGDDYPMTSRRSEALAHFGDALVAAQRRARE